jgi:hypothetical protein
MSKRKCIFTGQDSDFKLNIEQEDQHNWAKSVPTTKKYYEAWLKDRPLNELELRQVELFFQLEINKIKQSSLERRMENIRKQIADGITNFQTVEQLRFYKPDIQFNEEMEQDIKEKVNKNNLDNLDKFLSKSIPQNKEAKILPTPKKDDNIKKNKKVVKKKSTLWD